MKNKLVNDIEYKQFEKEPEIWIQSTIFCIMYSSHAACNANGPDHFMPSLNCVIFLQFPQSKFHLNTTCLFLRLREEYAPLESSIFSLIIIFVVEENAQQNAFDSLL